MNAWRRLVSFLDEREDAAALAAVRIAAATTVFLTIASTWRSGVWEALWVDAAHGGVRPVQCGALASFGGCTPANVQLAMAAALVSSALFAAGAYTRVTAVSTWVLWHFLVRLNWVYGGSSYALLDGVLFLLALSGSGKAWSVDASWRGRSGPVPAWPRRLIALQLVVMYTSTGLQKVGSGWLPGGPMDQIWYVLQDTSWHRWPMTWAWPLFPLTQLASAVTWVWENAAPLLGLALWYRRTQERPGRLRALFNRFDFRTKFLLLGVLLHGSIELTMEVGPFMAATLSLYPSCFSPAEWRAFVARVRARLARAPAPQPEPDAPPA